MASNRFYCQDDNHLTIEIWTRRLSSVVFCSVSTRTDTYCHNTLGFDTSCLDAMSPLFCQRARQVHTLPRFAVEGLAGCCKLLVAGFGAVSRAPACPNRDAKSTEQKFLGNPSNLHQHYCVHNQTIHSTVDWVLPGSPQLHLLISWASLHFLHLLHRLPSSP